MNLPSRIALPLAVACAACGTGARVQPQPPAAPPAPPPSVVIPSPPIWRMLHVCVVDRQGIRTVPVQYSTATGDTMIEGRPFAEVHPTDAGYAAPAEWFIRNEVLVLEGRRYVKYGLPRVLGADDLTPAGEYRGVPIFAQRGEEQGGSVRFVAVEPGCVFQPYEGPHYGAVRG